MLLERMITQRNVRKGSILPPRQAIINLPPTAPPFSLRANANPEPISRPPSPGSNDAADRSGRRSMMDPRGQTLKLACGMERVYRPHSPFFCLSSHARCQRGFVRCRRPSAHFIILASPFLFSGAHNGAKRKAHKKKGREIINFLGLMHPKKLETTLHTRTRESESLFSLDPPPCKHLISIPYPPPRFLRGTGSTDWPFVVNTRRRPRFFDDFRRLDFLSVLT